MPPLPSELVARIFILCLPGEPYVKADADSAPLLFMRVCRQWRAIAIQMPQLWCSLNDIQDSRRFLPLGMHGARLAGYAAWLSRSGNRPLSLAIPLEHEMTPRQSEEWVQFLRSYRGRFERLWVVDERGVNLRQILEGANILKHVALHSQDPYRADESLVLTCPLPSLRSVLFEGTDVAPATLHVTVWGSLTRLALRLPSGGYYLAREFVDLVSRCPNLQILVFGTFIPESAEHNGHQLQPFRPHPNLRFLTVVLRYPDLLGPVSPTLMFPALLRLRVRPDFRSNWGDDSKEGEENVVTLPSPQRFFQMEAERNEDFYTFGVGWATVTHLDVYFRADIDVFRTVMELCPNLQVLEMSGVRCSERSTSLPTRLTCPSLCELHITVNVPLGNILQKVKLPGLKILTVEAADCGEHSDFINMLLRSRCALETLEVWDVGLHGRTYWTEEERKDLLESLPTLTALKLDPFAY